MDAFQPTLTLTALFVVLTLAVVARVVSLVRRVAPFDRKDRWTAIAAGVALGWLALHAGVAASGVLTVFESPPLTPFYLATALIVGLGFAFSPLGTRLSQLPLIAIVGLNSFRLPLELILHELYKHGDLPVQMTWSGLNFDVLTGISALVLVMLRRDLPKAVFWAWNQPSGHGGQPRNVEQPPTLPHLLQRARGPVGLRRAIQLGPHRARLGRLGEPPGSLPSVAPREWQCPIVATGSTVPSPDPWMWSEIAGPCW